MPAWKPSFDSPDDMATLGHKYIDDHPIRPTIAGMCRELGISYKKLRTMSFRPEYTEVISQLVTRLMELREVDLADNKAQAGARFWLEAQGDWCSTSRTVNETTITVQHEDKSEAELRLAVAAKLRELGYSSIAELSADAGAAKSG